jgi:hypothetical protein
LAGTAAWDGWNVVAVVAGALGAAVALASCNSILGLDPVTLRYDGTGGVNTGTGGLGAGAGGSTGSGGAVTGSGGAGSGGVRAAAGAGSGGHIGTGGAADAGAGTGGTADAGAGTGGAGGGSGGRIGTGGAGGRGTGGRGGSCGQQLLRNGSFEGGSVVWSEVPVGSVSIIRRDDDLEVMAQGVSPQSPRYLARLGGTKNYFVTYLEQDNVVPSDAKELTIDGYVLILTNEVTTTEQRDIARIEIEFDVKPAPVFIQWSNLDAVSTWVHFTAALNPGTKAGQIGTLRILADLNEDEQMVPTYFFFDSVSLTVTACGP